MNVNSCPNYFFGDKSSLLVLCILLVITRPANGCHHKDKIQVFAFVGSRDWEMNEQSEKEH